MNYQNYFQPTTSKQTITKALTLFVASFFLFTSANIFGQATVVDLTSGTSWALPAGVTAIQVEVRGGGGGGGGRTSSGEGGGGGGGAYARSVFSGLTPLDNYTYSVGVGGAGSNNVLTTAQNGGVTSFSGPNITTITANGGNGVAVNTISGSTGGAAGTSGNQANFRGGNGANRTTFGVFNTGRAGGGGAGAGSSNDGANATINTGATGTNGGGNGGTGVSNGNANGGAGSAPGGGGGGADRTSGTQAGGKGGDGLVRITYTLPTITSYTPNTDLCTAGGQTVTITGTNFTGVSGVTFNGVNAASYTVVSATSITAVTPAGLTAGNIVVTNNGNFATSAAYTVFASVTPAVSMSANPINAITCQGNNITFTASPDANGGASPLYEWFRNGSSVQGPSTSNTYQSTALLNGDIITVSMTSNATCPSPATVSVGAGITVSFPLTVSIARTPLGPQYSGTAYSYTSTVNGATGVVTYDWSAPANASPASSSIATFNPTFTNATAANITVPVTLNITDAGTGCPASATQAPTVFPLPTTPTASGITTAVCQNVTNTFTTTTTATLGTQYSGFFWSVNPPAAASAVNSSTGEITWSSSYTGAATVSVYAVGVSPTLNSATVSTNVTVYAPPSAPTITVSETSEQFSNDGIVCSGSTATLTSSASTSYLWSTGGTGISIAPEPTTATTYTVTITDINGCKNNSSYEVTVTANPIQPAASTPQNFCASGTVAELTTSSGTAIQWYTAASGGSALTGSTSLSSTTYYATQTVNFCENPTRLPVVVNVFPAAPTTTGVNICTGQSGSLTSATTCSALSGSASGTNSNTFTLVNPPTVRNITLPVSGVPPGATITKVTLSLNIAHNYQSDVRLSLVSPDATTVALIGSPAANGNNLGNTTAGITTTSTANVRTYTFDQSASVNAWGPSNPAAAGSYLPTGGTLNTFNGLTAINGDWTLNASDVETNDNGVITSVTVNIEYSVSLIQWATSQNGAAIFGGSPFNPVGVAGSGLTNTTSPGTTSYYAYCPSNPTCRTQTDFIIVPGPTPTYTVTGGGTYCSDGIGLPVGLSGSDDATVSYQLQLDGSNVGSPVLGNNGAISFGNQTAAGTYTVLATTSSCSDVPMTGSVAITVLPAAPTTTGVSICTGQSGSLALTSSCNSISQTQTASGSGGTSELDAYGGGTNITINFPALPAGAIVTAVNTTISYTANTNLFGNANRAELRIRVSPPATIGAIVSDIQPTLTTGAGAITNQVFGNWGTGNPEGAWVFAFRQNADQFWTTPDINISNITISVAYTLSGALWYTSSSGGTHIGGGNTFNPVGVVGSGLTNTNTPGTTTYYAACPDNTTCRTATNFVINPGPTPTYTVTGGGDYCSDGIGLPVGLSGSDGASVSYQLQRNGANVGSPRTGTGAPLNFGNQTISGTYTILASGGLCSNVPMTGSAIINALPAVPSTTGVNICTNQTGSLLSTSCAPGTVTVSGINSNTFTITRNNLRSIQLPVSGVPAGATISKVTLSLNIAHNYQSDVILSLASPGGTSVSLTGAAGAGGTNTLGTTVGTITTASTGDVATYTFDQDAATVAWGANNPATAGSYLPSGGGTMNTFNGLSDINGNWVLSANDDGNGDDGVITSVTVSIQYSGSVSWWSDATGGSNLYLGSSFNPVGIPGSGLANTSTPGTTSYYAACITNPTCRTKTDFVINPGPDFSYTPTGGGTYCTDGIGLPVGLSGSDGSNVSYQLQLNGSNVGSPVLGNNGPISFGNQTGAGSYTVLATSATCTNVPMTGSVIITALPAAPTTTPVDICLGGSGSLAITSSCNTSAGPSITASGSGGTSEANTYGGAGNTNISIAFPALPAGAIVTSTTTTISFTSNAGSNRNQVRVRATPPAAVGAVQTDLQPSTSGSAGSVTNAAIGTWGTGNPAGNWLFEFRETTNNAGLNPDANITNITITVAYNLAGGAWYTSSSGGLPIASGTFNPVGVAGSGLTNTNTPGTTTYYAACPDNTTCRTATNFVIRSAFDGGILASNAQSICINTPTPNITYSTPPTGGGTTTFQWYRQVGSIAAPSGAFNGTGWTAVGAPSTTTPMLLGTTIGSLTATTTFALRVYDTGTTACFDNWAGNAHVITVNPRPTSTTSGSASVCVGFPRDVRVTLTGTAPWNITFSDGFVANGVTTSPYFRTVNDLATTTYTVTALSDANCTSIPAGRRGSARITRNACPNTWLGISNDWNATSNWSNGVLPGCGVANSTNVIIPTTPFGGLFPLVSGVDANADSITINRGATVTVDANRFLNVCGSWIAPASGTFSSALGDGVVNLNGTGTQTITGRTKFNTLKSSKTSGTATASATAVVEINTALELQGNGNFDAGTDRITFKSFSDMQCAVLDNFSNSFTGNFLGTIKAERSYGAVDAVVSSVTGARHQMSSPLNNVPVSQFGASGTQGYARNSRCDETRADGGSPYGNFHAYDESYAGAAICGLQAWYNQTTGVAENGRGYSVRRRSPGKITLTGSPNLNTSYTRTLTNSGWNNTTKQGKTDVSGYHIVGNPYLSNIELNAPFAGFSPNVYIWVTNGPLAGTYEVYNLNTDQAFIPPFGTFTIRNIGGSDPLTISNSNRTRLGTPPYYLKNNGEHLFLNVTNKETGLLDKTLVAFREDAKDEFDENEDAMKLIGETERHAIFTKAAEYDAANNILPKDGEDRSVPVGFYSGISGAFSMSFEGVNTFKEESAILLEDKFLGKWHNVRNGNYDFKSDLEDRVDRFVLHFNHKKLNAVKESQSVLPERIKFEMYPNPSQGIVYLETNAKDVVKIEITDINGRVVWSGEMTAQTMVDISSLAASVYQVKLSGEGGAIVKKLVKE